MPGTESQDVMSAFGSQAESTLQQVAQETSKTAEQPHPFKIYEEENESQHPPTHSITTVSEPDPQRISNDHSIITPTAQTPTNSLAAVAGGTAAEGYAKYSVLPVPDREAEQQILDGSALSSADVGIDGGSLGDSQQNEASSPVETEPFQIQAFAKLEFDDGDFYMNTYAIEIGRDIYAVRQAAELQARQDTETKSGKRSTSPCGSVTSSRSMQGTIVSSVASDSGGVMAVDHYVLEPTREPKSKKRKSRSSPSQQLPRQTTMVHSHGKLNYYSTDYNASALAHLMSLDPGLDSLGPNAILPSPDSVPLIPVHPPALSEGTPSSGKSISRKHIRIAYNFEHHRFEVAILGLNGGFVDEEFIAKGDSRPLTNGSIIQIGGVRIRFVLPDVGVGEIEAETETASFDVAESVEDENDEDIDDDGDRIRTFDIGRGGDEEEEEEDEEGEDGEAEESEVVRIRAKGKRKPEPQPLPVKKRKGPGRPPKNGIISKREQALLARQAREKAKVAADQDSGTPHNHGKLKAGKDTKAVKKEQPSLQPNGKRKYTKRKRAGGIDDQRVRESTEQTDSVPPEQSIAAKLLPKPAKEKKPPKAPRSPSPVFDESTLTEEQLRRPTQNYIVLIHEALSSSKTGAMALPQIYRAMQRKYPYFKLRAATVGWQSSVRHNLSQNAAFQKIERDGKGWMWGLVPGVSIEKEKKRKPTPPPEPQRPYYPPGAPTMQYPYPYPHPNMTVPPNHYMPRMPLAHLPTGRHMPHEPVSRDSRENLVSKFKVRESDSTYQSPYQPTLPPRQYSAFVEPPQANSCTNDANGFYSPSQGPAQVSNHSYPTHGSAPNPSPASTQPKIDGPRGSLGESTGHALPSRWQSNPAPPTNGSPASSLPAAASTDAEIAVKDTLTNGDARRRDSAVDEAAAAAVEYNGSGKRPLENGGAGDGATDQGQSKAKRAAIKA